LSSPTAPFGQCITLLTNTPGSMPSSRSPDMLPTLHQFWKKWFYLWGRLWRPQLRIPTPTLCIPTRLLASRTTDYNFTLLRVTVCITASSSVNTHHASLQLFILLLVLGMFITVSVVNKASF
jgi:hypothetical protein